MAIQLRRGNYADLDPSRLVQGEPFTTLDELPDGDVYVGVGLGMGRTVRLATYTNLQTVLAECRESEKNAKESESKAKDSEDKAKGSEMLSKSYAIGDADGVRPDEDTDNSKYYKEQAEGFWNLMDNALKRITPEMKIDFTTGRVSYEGSFFEFNVNYGNGHLEWGLAI